MKLQIKLRHIDIYLHWLRQEVQRGFINICWVSTNKMIADSLIKALMAKKKNSKKLFNKELDPKKTKHLDNPWMMQLAAYRDMITKARLAIL